MAQHLELIFIIPSKKYQLYFCPPPPPPPPPPPWFFLDEALDFQVTYRLISLTFMSTCHSELERLSIFWRLIAQPQATDCSKSFLTTKSNNCDKLPEKNCPKVGPCMPGLKEPMYTGLKGAHVCRALRGPCMPGLKGPMYAGP